MRARWLAVVVGVLLVGVTVPAQAANILTNPGFETGSLSGWTCSGGSVVSTPVRTGGYALNGAVTSSDYAQCSQTVSVQPNTAYTLSAWVRGSYVYLGVAGGVSTWTPSATSFTELSVAFTTGASQTSAQIYVHGWYGQPAYQADDFTSTAQAAREPGVPERPRHRYYEQRDLASGSIHRHVTGTASKGPCARRRDLHIRCTAQSQLSSRRTTAVIGQDGSNLRYYAG